MSRRTNPEERDRKRAGILAAAREVFSEMGYNETTMAMIARKANMPISSLYNYFQNKEDLFKSTGLEDELYQLRPEYDRRRKTILDNALRLMGQSGFSTVTLDEIAACSGVPKASFYQFFDSKEDLFATLLTESPLQESAYELDINDEDPLCRKALRTVGQSYLTMGDNPERTAIFRMTLVESYKNPEAGRLFYSEGISKVCDSLAAYLRGKLPPGRMTQEELKLASWLFLSSLWANNIMFKVIKGTERQFSDQQTLDMAVEIFTAWLKTLNEA